MAKYFNYFPKTAYFLEKEKQSLDIVTNLTSKFKFDSNFKENSVVYYDYVVTDGETPEVISDKIYGSPEKHWIILALNDIVHPQLDWPLEQKSLISFIGKKYKERLNTAISQTFIITSVQNPSGSGAIYQVDGLNKPVLTLVRGGVYTFDQSSATNITHQIAFKDDTGVSYTTGVVTTGSVGTAGAKTIITVANNAPNNLRYYCVTHGNNMGNTITVQNNNNTSQMGIDWAQSNYKEHFITETITVVNTGSSTISVNQITEQVYANTTDTSASYTIFANTVVEVSKIKSRKTYFDYEIDNNESKRSIKLLKTEFIPLVEEEFRNLL